MEYMILTREEMIQAIESELHQVQEILRITEEAFGDDSREAYEQYQIVRQTKRIARLCGIEC